KPTSQLLTVDDICIGQQTNLTVTFPVGTAPFNYTLQNNLTGGTTNYTANSSQATLSVSPNQTTTYSVIAVTDANNCAATQMTNASTITVNPLPQPVVVGDNAVCDGQSSVLSTASVSPAYVNYVWSQSGATTSTISVNTTGSYSVTVTDVNGCVNTSPSFAFTVNDNPVIDFTNDTSLACEISNINFTNLSTYEPNATFAWTLAPGVTSALTNPSHVYTTPGTYQISLTIVNPTGCTSSDTKPVDITFFPLPEAKFIADPLATNIYSSGINFYDQSANAVSWSWNFGDDNTSSVQNPSHYYGSVGEYMVKLVVTNIAGCVSEYQQQVIVNPFYLPNAFTPNKDGKNDFFFDPGFSLDVASYNMKIFNRWGQKFFETETPAKTWDGSDPAGAKAPQGVYVYSIDVKTKEGKSQQYNGTVTLLR
ncbi:MAG TPA: PKD domain-containing protein, partial [Bacteroidia bacterium]|nr:PKD domain-containing protein [Bacteroidia bacterium]